MAYGISSDILPSDTDDGIIASMDRAWTPSIMNTTKLASAGVMVDMTTPGAANARFGPYIFVLPYIQHNALAVLGQKPYQSGVRLITDLSIASTTSAGVVRDNVLTSATTPSFAQLLEPYKNYMAIRKMPIGFVQLGADKRDDVVDWENFLKTESQTFVWNQDVDVLRRIEDAPIVGLGSVAPGESITSTERVGFESIERIVSNASEAAHLPDTYAIPWYNSTTLMSGANTNLATYRGQSAAAGSMFDSYVDSNYTESDTAGAATLRPLTMDMMDSMIYACMPYWNNGNNETGGKAFITDYTALQKIGGIIGANNRLLGWEGVNYSVNGVNTVPGRKTGLMVSHYNGIPIIPDYNVEKGVAGEAIGSQSGIGRIYLVDQNTLYMAPEIQPQVETTDSAFVAGGLNRAAMFKYWAELQCRNFKGQGKIIHIN